MFGDSKKRLIFTISTKVIDDTEKRTHNQLQCVKYKNELHKRLSEYANHCKADFCVETPEVQDYDILNVWKIKQWEKHLNNYDEVMYLDFDIVPNTDISIFEKFNFDKIITHLIPTPISRFVSSRFDLENKESFIKTLDKYHWYIKTNQVRDMLMSQIIMPKNQWMMNTGTFGGNRRIRDELKFSERLDEVRQVVDEVKEYDDRYFYNNETMLTYMIEKYNVPVENLPVHWHQLILSDTDLRICKTSSLIHVITKDFENVFKNL